MKKLTILIITLSCLVGFNVYAQKEKDGKMMTEKHQGMMEGTNMMMGDMEMKKGMGSCFERMDGMMTKMKPMMEKDMTQEQRNKMANMMKDMSKHMMDMSMMMMQGTCSMEGMGKLEKNISETENEFEDLRKFW
ncbi:MAG: hypothetical protein KKF30_09435 [Proteobacteria bacterium]|nr:hypothetical protein [Pseudomonadota bacterium]MBU4470595.1 hypothetical protein [Pseudomonadota bacterium]MCG2751430.1 hypothetical protein [Desulfobacteraceae bacterium]